MRPAINRKEMGDAAEDFVARWLEEQGAQVVERNLRLSYLEIDIVAIFARMVLVVEVRTRSASSLTSGFSSINYTKRKRLRYAGERLWSRHYKNDPRVDRLRFDVASVTYERCVTEPATTSSVNLVPALEYAPAAF